MRLVLVRHGESEWNRLNLFTGWHDVDLSERGRQEAVEAGELLKKDDYDFDVCFTSYLKRAVHTLNPILEKLDRDWLPVIKDWRLNERHYGALQGLNKSETAAKYGEDQVLVWRRSYDVPPPPMEGSDTRSPRYQTAYRNEDKDLLPLAESLADTVARVVPYYQVAIQKQMEMGKRVLVVAHGNSLRALVKHLEKISDQAIVEVNIPTGIPLVYELDETFGVLNKYYLGDQDQVRLKMEGVASQGKAAG